MEDQKKATRIYLEELIRWNKTINLVSRRDIDSLYERHYQDSLAPLPYLTEGAHVLDIGSGNGFPSIPISIHREDLMVSAMESNLKKAVFLDHLKVLLGLDNFIVLKKRAGAADSQKNEFDFVISRAFSNVQKFVETAVDYLKDNGTIIHFNSLISNNIQSITSKKNTLINNVESVVYKSADGIKRTLLLIKLKKT